MFLKRSRSMKQTAKDAGEPAGARDRAVELGEEHVAIGQAGQAVVARQFVHLLLGERGLRDIAADAAVASEVAAVVEHRLAADADVASHAVGPREAVGEVAKGLARVDAGFIGGDRLGRGFECRGRHPLLAEQQVGAMPVAASMPSEK